MNVTLYSTNCPKCHILEQKLNQKKIPYNIITDVELMQSKGFLEAPMLEVNNDILNFSQAISWVNQLV